ncbi:MAG: hypothetical protein ABFC62_11640 [Clostridiaceae bacterium]|nr:hypothetical protein [Eubacteriales bacterium]
MVCGNCKTAMPEGSGPCSVCGAQTNASTCAGNGHIGYSDRIHDPAFTGYISKTNRWSAIFSMILAVAAVIGFYIYGEISSEMENPQALYIGFGIGGLFLIIALFQILGRKRSKTWDGVVVDKTIKKKSRHQSTGNDDYTIKYYTEYAVVIREDATGKKHRMIAEDDLTVFNYFQVGERVRRHAGLNSYEKYDKSKDSIIFCNACGTMCSIADDVCFRCKCPLLK